MHVFAAGGFVHFVGEGVANVDGADVGPGCEIGFVETVAVAVSAADEEEGFCYCSPGLDLFCALLHKGSEGGDSCSGTDHYEGHGGDVEGWVEALVGRADGDSDFVAGSEAREVIRGDT